MNHLSDKKKEDAKKILSSKHLFYEQMCSYHNNNREYLPEDHALQHSLLLALRSKGERDPRRDTSGNDDEDDQSVDSDYEENDEEQHHVHANMRESSTHKRTRHGDAALVTSSFHKGSEKSGPIDIEVDINKAFPGGTNWSLMQQDLASQTLEVQKRLLQIEEKDLELKRQRLKWDRYRKKKDREIERMEMENQQMMIDNKHLANELRQKEIELELKIKCQANNP